MDNEKNFYIRHQRLFDKFSGLLFSNTVLERGLVVSTVIIMGNSLKKSVGLGITFFLLTFFTVCITYIVPRSIPRIFRVIINTMISACLFIPTSIFVNALLPDIILSVGIFMPLLITNSLIVGLSISRFHTQNFIPMLTDLLSHLLGFTFVICIVGIIREILGNASIWDIPIDFLPKVPAVLYPFSGFIIVGFFAAGLKKFKNFFTRGSQGSSSGFAESGREAD